MNMMSIDHDNTQSDPADDAAERFVGYFGYGSLVNRATLRTRFVSHHPAQLAGWRRVWRQRPNIGFASELPLPLALLSVEPAHDSIIDGAVIVDRSGNISSVDARERFYARRPLKKTALSLTRPSEALPNPCDVHVYQALPQAELDALGQPEKSNHAGMSIPDQKPSLILQSYLDAVLQGFFRAFGHEGASRFVNETGNFDSAIVSDRRQPLYPRAVEILPGERRLFDRLLEERGVHYVSPPGE